MAEMTELSEMNKNFDSGDMNTKTESISLELESDITYQMHSKLKNSLFNK